MYESNMESLHGLLGSGACHVYQADDLPPEWRGLHERLAAYRTSPDNPELSGGACENACFYPG